MAAAPIRLVYIASLCGNPVAAHARVPLSQYAWAQSRHTLGITEPHSRCLSNDHGGLPTTVADSVRESYLSCPEHGGN